MLYDYPYTDLYNLNLDWMIKAIKQMQAIVEPLSIIVNTFNGRHGNVELTQDDVNGVMVDVLWISAPGDTIDDLPQASLDSIYRIGRRIMIFINNLNVPDTIYFLKWQSGHARPQLYSPTAALAGVASFNGQTGNVTATGSDLDTSDSDSTSIAETLSAQSQQISTLTELVTPIHLNTSDVIDFDTSFVDYSVVQPTATASIIGKLAIININLHPIQVASLINKTIGTLKYAIRPARNAIGQAFVIPIYNAVSKTYSVVVQALTNGMLRFLNNGGYHDLDNQITTLTDITITIIYETV